MSFMLFTVSQHNQRFWKPEEIPHLYKGLLLLARVWPGSITSIFLHQYHHLHWQYCQYHDYRHILRNQKMITHLKVSAIIEEGDLLHCCVVAMELDLSQRCQGGRTPVYTQYTLFTLLHVIVCAKTKNSTEQRISNCGKPWIMCANKL